ncbi:hypothetical protein SAZ10_12795 [Mesorhizobium sp. BAC0120]|uniref:hypothetical protein n=1 Tax=Mesorhizobium sp. BAC0120 TaxID=3090670 RepID=UPI00298CF110|nr:hypothetical protein [Mesorhizobium sp. BAC0120]MDW6022633.1 hypothetical protein [Mesorhizobium sp. BAC0120]
MKRALLAFAAILLFLPPTAALENAEVEAVVTILEALSPERGEQVYYDEDAAGDWFDFDAETDARIPAAGFSRESWQRAYDETLKGLMATIPDAEFDAIFAGSESRINASPALDETQKRQMIEDWREELGKARALRASGSQFREVVSPFASRLQRLSPRQ